MGQQPTTALVVGVVEDGGEEARLASRGCRVEPTRARRQGIGDSRNVGATRLAAEVRAPAPWRSTTAAGTGGRGAVGERPETRRCSLA